MGAGNRVRLFDSMRSTPSMKAPAAVCDEVLRGEFVAVREHVGFRA
jgi:hypothetical protein